MLKVLISGGGTGGHIFPALAIAKYIKEEWPDALILFVGAEGGMENTLVPKNGFPIKPLWISGLYRQKTLKNLFRNALLPFKLLYSNYQANKIIREFKPDLVIGVGGYASYPILKASLNHKILTLIHEQNAFPGLANKMLAEKVNKVLLGNEDAATRFKSNNCMFVGNPVRPELLKGNRDKGVEQYKLDPNKKTILITGGSLGAKNLNNAVLTHYQELISRYNLIWQCGKIYFDDLKTKVDSKHLFPFLDNMADTYAVADLVICRAGAMTISELIHLNKPAVLIPSPNVADDHQTFNAKSLSDKNAAILLKDSEAQAKLLEVIENSFQEKNYLALQEAITNYLKPKTKEEILGFIKENLKK